MKREDKKQFVSDLHTRLEKAQAAFLVHYQGLKVEEMETLRGNLRDSGSELEVVKNRLLKRASKGTQTEAIEESMKGPTAIALTYDDLIGPAKAIVDFVKDSQKLEIKSAQISGKKLDAEAVKALANLPGREALLAQLLGGLQAVPSGFVRVLGGLMRQLLNVLKAIEQQKEN